MTGENVTAAENQPVVHRARAERQAAERLTFYHNGIQWRLTNVHGHVVKDILT